MALMKLSTYQKNFVKDDRPDRRTIIRWIKNGEIYGEQRGKHYYVDPEKQIVAPVNDLVLRTFAS